MNPLSSNSSNINNIPLQNQVPCTVKSSETMIVNKVLPISTTTQQPNEGKRYQKLMQKEMEWLKRNSAFSKSTEF